MRRGGGSSSAIDSFCIQIPVVNYETFRLRFTFYHLATGKYSKKSRRVRDWFWYSEGVLSAIWKFWSKWTAEVIFIRLNARGSRHPRCCQRCYGGRIQRVSDRILPLQNQFQTPFYKSRFRRRGLDSFGPNSMRIIAVIFDLRLIALCLPHTFF